MKTITDQERKEYFYVTALLKVSVAHTGQARKLTISYVVPTIL